MRADIHDGPEHILQSETEYIDARLHLPASTKTLLQRAAGPYIGSFSAGRAAVAHHLLSALHRKRPDCCAQRNDAKGQKQTFKALRVPHTSFPGFIMSSGSKARLSVRITPTAASPNSGTRKCFLPSPIPCSPVQVPSAAIASSASRSMKALARATSSESSIMTIKLA